MKKNYLALALLLPGVALADRFAVESGGEEFIGPTVEEVELLGVKEAPPVGSDRPMLATVRNNSALYLDRVAIQCTVTDERGYRVFRDLVFKSAPIFSVKIDFPPIKLPEKGIPPGQVAELGMYTDDNRWFRGYGKFRYDCEMYGVAGSE